MLLIDSDGIEIYLLFTPSLVNNFIFERIYNDLTNDNVICNEKDNVENINSFQIAMLADLFFPHE